MTIYIALLRGINVSGHKLIKMAELKEIFAKMGLQQVQTYIQSGNVLFVSKEEEAPLRQRIEQGILTALDMPITVILRTASELERLIADCPYPEDASRDKVSLYVSFLTEAPTEEQLRRLPGGGCEPDKFSLHGRDMYLFFDQSIRNSKLANQINNLDVPSTTRNWNTVKKLSAMAQAMAE
ncbi:DUF1697 domain-containing protein [Paenibacillus thiaminolyticus]|uniref:DUF1697 domain-containing protein n=1 Tax=Paenibacillus thiaminolyticus TaxID=49283 RepID=UPI00232CB7F3|nr:DUF1697 domain-containing protein [Paenibacillus thiaminolyticus]WCF06533.1 DUF1697 domain-containing protein [Paenibacillus thiaminolyticus]